MAVSHFLVILLPIIHTKGWQEESELQTEKEQEGTHSLHPPEAQQKQGSLFSPGSRQQHRATRLRAWEGATGG